MNRPARWSARMAVLFGLVSPSALLAQEPARSLDELARWIRIGDQVTVTEATGRTATGRIADLHPDTLALAVGETVRNFQQDQISAISRREHDSLGNGALIGAGVGAGLFVTVLATGGGCTSEPDCGAMMLLGTLFYAGVGAGIGVGVDALVPGRQAVIFRRPAGRVTLGLSPHLVPGRRGVALSLGF